MGVGIQVKDLNAWFGKKQALYDINMTALANHCTAVIGPSGCGKSTFVRCINRMHETIPEARAAGSVMIGEVDLDMVLGPHFPGTIFGKRLARTRDHPPAGRGETFDGGVSDTPRGTREDQRLAVFVGCLGQGFAWWKSCRSARPGPGAELAL